MDNQIVKIKDPFDPFSRQQLSVPYMEGRTVGDLVDISGMKGDVVAWRNGFVCDNFKQV